MVSDADTRAIALFFLFSLMEEKVALHARQSFFIPDSLMALAYLAAAQARRGME